MRIFLFLLIFVPLLSFNQSKLDLRDLKSIIKRVIRFLVRLTVSELRLDTSFTSRILPSNTSKVTDGYHYFVGYYDIDPVNIDGKILFESDSS